MNVWKLRKVYSDKVLLETPDQTGLPEPEKPLNPKEQELLDKLEIKIATAKVKLFEAAPELARIIAQLNIKVVNSNDPYVQTMAVDNFGNIYINPAFGDHLSDNEFYGVFAHEALHIANGTFLRRGGRDMPLWNIATDAIMNWGLLRDGFELPKEGIKPDVNTGEFKIGPVGMQTTAKVLDDKGYPLAAEEIYEQLNKQRDSLINKILKGMQKIRNKQKQQQGQQQPGQGKPQQGQGQPQQGQGQGQQQPGQGNQPGQPQQGQGGDEEGDDFELDILDPNSPHAQKGQQGQQQKGYTTTDRATAEKAAEDYFKRLDNKTDKHLTDGEARKANSNLDETLTPEKMEELERARQEDIKRGEVEARRQSSVGRGNGVGGIRSVLSSSIPLIVDWKNVIRRYLKAACSRSVTWMKPNRRGLAGGYMSPGRSTAADKLNAVFAVDTSGSIGDEELGEAFAYIKQIAAQVTEINVRICLWHSETYYISKPVTTRGALEDTLRAMKENVQSGGTTISSIDPFLKKNGISPVVVIYITDGYVEGNPSFGPYQKLFIIVNKQARNPSVREGIDKIFGKFGQVVITPTLD